MIQDITESIEEPVTLADLKRSLVVESALDDDLLESLLPAAREQAEHYANVPLVPRTYRLTLDGFAMHILLPKHPVIEVLSVHYDTDDGEELLPSSAYQLLFREEGTFLAPAYGESWPPALPHPGSVRVVFRAGYETLPASAAQAIMRIAGDLYKYRDSSAREEMRPLPYSAERLLSGLRMPTR